MESLKCAKACDALALNELPESLNAEQIAKLYYPESNKSIERKWIKNKIQAAIDNGIVEISSGAISKPDTSKKMQIISLGSSIPKRPERELDEWIELFNGLDCGTAVVYSEYGGLAFLKERLSNGWPSEWEVQIKSFIHQYSLIPLISSFHYEAWTDKPEPTEGSFLNGWLGISKQGSDKQQVNVDADIGIHAGTPEMPKERDLTIWMRETWINEGKIGGSAFFNALKKYVNKTGSPIVEHYTTGKNGAGIRWNTGNATNVMTKKTIQTKVSRFKKTP
jgi:hypothetical protein